VDKRQKRDEDKDMLIEELYKQIGQLKVEIDWLKKKSELISEEEGLAHLSKSHPGHKIYPYLLRNLKINRINQVWGTDITYIRLSHGCYT